jgi:neutral ceramidase
MVRYSTNALSAGVARRNINARPGTPKFGLRLFGEPIQGYESDLTATALVLANSETKLAIIALDLIVFFNPLADQVRQDVADRLGIPRSHVLINFSHDHSTPAQLSYRATTPESQRFAALYEQELHALILEAMEEADGNLLPVRVAAGRGEAKIGVYRRETSPNGHDVLGEVPDRDIDHSVSVVRIDDLQGQPVAILFSYGCHPVAVGPRCFLGSSDFPGAAREMVERVMGGKALFLQGCGGNVNPRWGIGYEVDCRYPKNRLGMILAGEVLKVAAEIHTHMRLGERVPLGNIPNILFHPWLPVEGGDAVNLAAAEEIVKLHFIDLPPLEQAQALYDRWAQQKQEKIDSRAQDWEIRLASEYEQAYRRTLNAIQDGDPTIDLDVQVLRIGDVILAGLGVEAFTETGLQIKARSPFKNTIPLGWNNTSIAYLPREEDYPPGGFKLGEVYHVPDLLVQAYQLPTALQPEAEQIAVDKVIELIERLTS